jgi:hypothetical protein
LAIFSPDWVLPSGQASHYGYGQAFALVGVILLSTVAVPVGFLIAQVTAVLVSRRAAANHLEQGPTADISHD